MTDDSVRAQYEAYPYPERDPADEARRLITGSPSHLLEVNHYLFGGRRDFTVPFRALVAGGGTGDAAIMLAQQLADLGSPGEVVYIDVSDASRAIAEARAKARGLANLSFHNLSILDLERSDLGEFDYIDCCGVLHHLEDPMAGLSALAGMLAQGGGLGAMLYGELGRTGVYHMQTMMRMLDADGDLAGRVALARRLHGNLPRTNWLRRNPFVADHLSGGDAGLVDLFLHARDRAYRVAEIAELTSSCGLEIAAFIEPARYEPQSYLNDAKLLALVQDKPWLERCAFAELLAGNMRTHVFYAVKADDGIPAPPRPDDPRAVPRLRDMESRDLAEKTRPGATMRATIDGFEFRFAMPPLAAAMIARIDGKRCLGDIHGELFEANPKLDWDAFAGQFAQLYAGLNGLGKLLLSFHPESD